MTITRNERKNSHHSKRKPEEGCSPLANTQADIRLLLRNLDHENESPGKLGDLIGLVRGYLK
jgi:hypothetical protein